MPSTRDEEKLLLQIEDSIPEIKDRINKIRKFSKKFRQIITAAPAAPLKISRKGLEAKLTKLKEAEEILYSINDLSMKMDQHFGKKKATQRRARTKKELTGLSKVLQKSIDEINNSVAALAKRKAPKPLKLFGKSVFKVMNKTLVNKGQENFYIDITGPIITFVFYLKVPVKLEGKEKHDLFIVISREFNQNTLKMSGYKLSIFRNVFRRPPYDYRSAKDIPTETAAVKMIMMVLEGLGYGDILTKKIDVKNLYKRDMKALKELKDKYIKVAVSKNNVQLFVNSKDIRDPKTYKVAHSALKELLVDIKTIFNADKRKLGFIYKIGEKYYKNNPVTIVDVTFNPRAAIDLIR